ncbi:Uncharacterised protein [Salmonella enterica subsp. enterica serovar Bovismorbificans]|uniref:Uncharacterized protein n=1 Tax=Salmonella enterica subsp. enterica serovar Bovismorbificans TaxID=58097 RepID=A0A655BR64_SALET|nr:Uncharacterised protein [Salmonella enterica subsp. enterica serovar Bovismorbificans]
MRARAAATAHQCDIAGVAQQLRQFFQLFLRRRDDGVRGMVPMSDGVFRRRFQRHVTRKYDHGDAAV